jgi:hypothetical protein
MSNPDRLHPVSDDSPESPDGRAKPGDVLGIERDGETTHLGETREDEDERREEAEDAVRKEPERG